MAKTALAVLENSVCNMIGHLTANDNVPYGFSIVAAAVPGREFNVFTPEAMAACGFEEEVTITPDGFVVISEEYFAYLNKLQDEGKEHPLNIDKLPFNGMSGFIADMPTLEECQALNELPTCQS